MNSSLDWMNEMSGEEIIASREDWNKRSDHVPLKCRTIKDAFLFDGYFKKFSFWIFFHFFFPIFRERNLAVCIRLQQLCWFKKLRLMEARKSCSLFQRFPFCVFYYVQLGFLIAVCSYWKSFLQKHYNTQVSPFADIGPGIILSGNSNLQIAALVRIGKNFHIGANVTLVAGDRGWPIIGDNVTLWTNSVVVGNAKVGNHAVIGANAVVTKDIPPYATAIGVPAKVIKINKPSSDLI